MSLRSDLGRAHPSGATSAAAGFARLRRRRRLRPLWWALLAAGAGGLLGFLGWVVWFSPLLDLRVVAVRGNTGVQTASVLRAAQAPRGEPLARVDADAVADRVARLRPVRSVAVDRDWPHTLRITVAERVPVAALREGASYVLLDRAGVAFRTVARPPAGLPRVVVAPWTVADREPAVRAAAAVADALPPALVRRLVVLTARSRDAVTLRLRGDARVVWGSADRSGRKARVLLALLEHARRSGTVAQIRTYDVSVPDRPATR